MSEAMCVCGEDPVAEHYDGLCRDCWLGICGCPDGTHVMRRLDFDAFVRAVEAKAVLMSLSLAQRILAALEREATFTGAKGAEWKDPELVALADELRGRIA